VFTGQFLNWAAEHCIDFDEWKRLKDVAELRVDYFTEMKSFDHKTSVLGLMKKVKEHAKGLATSNSETSKRAFFLGRASHLLRKRDGGKTWMEICNSIGEGLSQKSMANYEKYFVFVSKYPCFLRVKISYTGLLKYSTALTKHFKENPAVAAGWEDLECE